MRLRYPAGTVVGGARLGGRYATPVAVRDAAERAVQSGDVDTALVLGALLDDAAARAELAYRRIAGRRFRAEEAGRGARRLRAQEDDARRAWRLLADSADRVADAVAGAFADAAVAGDGFPLEDDDDAASEWILGLDYAASWAGHGAPDSRDVDIALHVRRVDGARFTGADMARVASHFVHTQTVPSGYMVAGIAWNRPQHATSWRTGSVARDTDAFYPVFLQSEGAPIARDETGARRPGTWSFRVGGLKDL